jgi:glycerophosphoryl diester phosphodiesterase
MVSEKWSGVRATHRARRVGTKYILMNQKWLWWGFIRNVSRRGWKLGTYTLDDPVKARRWAKHGLWAVFTDYPDQFKK